MKHLKEHLRNLNRIERKSYHPLIHEIHKNYAISHNTLFYIKEYGPHSNVPKTIIRESLKILLLASLIDTFGGLAVERVKDAFLSLLPLVILLPTLNDLLGDFATIVSGRFSTMLHEGVVGKGWSQSKPLRKLLAQILIVALFTGTLASSAALIISMLKGYALGYLLVVKIFFVVLADVALLVTILFFLTVVTGLYFYKRREDPNNFLITITTSVADFGNMIILAVLVSIFF